MSATTVLLIDDEEAFVTTLAERLELRGLKPRVAFHGQAGLDMLAQKLPDIVVLDLRMPGMGGMEVLQHIQKRWPQLPVIILSGHGSEQDLEACLEKGAATYHSKPLDIDVLLKTIESIRSQGSP